MAEGHDNHHQPEVQKHDLEQVWTTVHGMQQSQTETQSRLTGLESTVSGMAHELKNIGQLMHQLITQKPERVQWVAIGMLVLGVLGVTGGYIQARLAPIEASISGNSKILMDRLQNLPDDYFQFGYNKAQIEAHSRVIEKLSDAVYDDIQETEANTAKVEMLREWVRSVDNRGSRAHVETVPELRREEL